jgi:hypothetical protein
MSPNAPAAEEPAPRKFDEASDATRVATLNPGPPKTVSTTPASPGPVLAISPAVEQPISGVLPVCCRIPATSFGPSY